jgi:hypothetical protein
VDGCIAQYAWPCWDSHVDASAQQDVYPGAFAPFVLSTPVGVVEIARLQSQGAAYLTVTSSR